CCPRTEKEARVAEAAPRSPVLVPSARAWTLAAAAGCLLPPLLQLPGALATGLAALAAVVSALSWRRRLPRALRLLLSLAPGARAAGLAAGAAGVSARSCRRGRPRGLRLLLRLALVALGFARSGPGLGRDTGCALLAAMLAIKPMELATLRDGRSLLGFALFAPFATFLLDQGPISLALGLAGALAALAAMLRLAELESGDDAVLPPRDRLRGVTAMAAIGLP